MAKRARHIETTVGIRALRDKLSEYVGQVELEHQELVITREGQPVAKIVPLEPQPRRRTPLRGRPPKGEADWSAWKRWPDGVPRPDMGEVHHELDESREDRV